MTDLIINSTDDDGSLKNFQKGYLTLPFDSDQFKEFITKLLGVPQRMSKKIEGNFELHLKDIQNFHDLVTQRIEQQNNGKLIQFQTKIYFSDGSNVTLGNYEALVSYNEVKPVTSVAVVLTWDYLIHFVDKDSPEKQLITLDITTSNYEKEEEEPNLKYIGNIGTFELQIDHTARSWAYDIEHLFTKQIKSIIQKETLFCKLLEKHEGKFIGSCLALYFSIFMFGALKAIDIFNTKQVANIKKIIAENKTIKEHLYLLSEMIANGESSEFFLKVVIFLLIAIIISFFLTLWTSELLNYKQPSFLVLTRQSKKYKDKIQANIKKEWYWFFFSIIISICTGITSNYIFTFLVN